MQRNQGGWKRLGILLGAIVFAPSAIAELPALEDGRWNGCFLAFENKCCQFSLSQLGKGSLVMVNDKGKALARGFTIPIEFGIEEKQQDGTWFFHPLLAETLKSNQPATVKLTDIKFHGSVQGAACLEVCINENHGAISLEAKLLERGSLTQALRSAIRMEIPNGYPYDKFRAFDGGRIKAFAEKTKQDRLQFKGLDGQSHHQSLAEPIHLAADPICRLGISQLLLEMSTYKGRKLELRAAKKSALLLKNPAVMPLHDGFCVTWIADPVKDPRERIPFLIEVR